MDSALSLASISVGCIFAFSRTAEETERLGDVQRLHRKSTEMKQ
jgi:hypothetical protein